MNVTFWGSLLTLTTVLQANFYLVFYFIAGSLTDKRIDPFGHNMGKYIFIVLRYACILVMCMQFILSMGNRPHGYGPSSFFLFNLLTCDYSAKNLYLTGMIVYSVIMAYTAFCTIYLVVLELMARAGKESHNIKVTGTLFVNIIISLLSTVGLYFFSSFVYLDPWHMFTSSAQYFALLPSYVCTLQVYAFCNTHDVTWGTKGDNTINTDLGAAKAVSGSTVELEMPSEQLDIDSGYDAALRDLRDRLEVPEEPVSESQMQEDYYRAVRTYMVLFWMIANVILAMAVSEVYGVDQGGSNVYLAIILWSVASLAVIRTIGSCTYAFLNVVHKLVEGKTKFEAGNITASNAAPSVDRHGAALAPAKPPQKYGGDATIKDRFNEAGWTMKRKMGKMTFWRKDGP